MKPAYQRPNTYIKIAIKTCINCPHSKEIDRTYAGSSTYKCDKLHRIIAKDVAVTRDMPDIPDDCPVVVERPSNTYKRKHRHLKIED